MKDYLPLNFNKTYDFIFDECGYSDNISTEEIITELLDDRFCRHIYKNGKNVGNMCLSYTKNKKTYNGKPLCGRHFIVETKKYKKYKSKCLYENCKSYSKINGYCNKHKLPPLPEPNYEENRFFFDQIYIVKYKKPIYININVFKFYKRFVFKKTINYKKTMESNITYFIKNNIILKVINKYNIYWLKIKSVFVFKFLYEKKKKVQKKEVSQNTPIFKNKKYIEFYLYYIYYMLKNINDIEVLKNNLFVILNIISYNMNINDIYLKTRNVKNYKRMDLILHKNNNLYEFNNIFIYIFWSYYNTIYKYWSKFNFDIIFKNEFPIYIKKEYKLISMGKETIETTSYGIDINEFKEFIDEYNNNKQCNINNEIKKINILKNDIVNLFKKYNIVMGPYKKSLIALIKDIQLTQSNNKLTNKIKYIEIRNVERCYYEHNCEDIILIKNSLKKNNIEIIDTIDFNEFISKLLKIVNFFNHDYIYFINNYNHN